MKKRVLSFLLAALMVFSLLPVTAFATGDSWSYDADTKTFTVNCTIPEMKEVGENIPEGVVIDGNYEGVVWFGAVWGKVVTDNGYEYGGKEWVNPYNLIDIGAVPTFEAGEEYGYLICIEYIPETMGDLADAKIVLNGKEYDVGVSIPYDEPYPVPLYYSYSEIFIAVDFGTLNEEGNFEGGDFEEVAPTITINEVKSDYPWDDTKGAVSVNYSLGGIDPNTEYTVKFDISADGQNVSDTNDAAKLTEGQQAVKTIETVSQFGEEVTDENATLKITLLSGEETVATAQTTFVLGPHTHKDAGGNDITFQPWDESDSLPGQAGNYYLDTDVTLGYSWNVPNGETNLCLNGHVITMTSSTDRCIQIIGATTTLNLYDCGETAHYFAYSPTAQWSYIASPTNEQKTGAITEDKIDDSTESGKVIKVVGGCITGTGGAGGVLVAMSGKFNLYGGNIVGNAFNNFGGGVGLGLANGSTSFHMYGGSIMGNKCDTNGGGGVGINMDSSFIMENGTISHNIGNGCPGGGVSVNSGTFTMNGGTVSHNKSTVNGGGVSVSSISGFTMTGGTITGNTADGYGSGVYDSGTVTLGGTAKVENNFKGAGETKTADNLYVDYSKFVNLGTKEGENDGNGVVVPDTSKMRVGVTMYSNGSNINDTGKFTTSGTEEQAACFTPDNADYIVKYNNNSTEATTDDYLELAVKPPVTRGLEVTKDGGTPVEGTDEDYYWEGDVLHIRASGLTVSGKTEKESIVVEEGVETLTLNGVTIAPTEFENRIVRAIESYSESLTITLKGNNRIGNEVIYSEGTEGAGYDDATEPDEYLVKTGIEGHNLTFTGEGNLTIYDREQGIKATNVTFAATFKGTLTVEDYGDFEPGCAINAEGVWDESEGDYVGGDVTLLGGTFDLTSYMSNGIYAGGNVTLSDVTANIFAAEDAIYADGNVSIDLGGKTVQLGKTVPNDSLTDESAYEMRFGIEAANVTVTGSGNLTIYDREQGISATGDVTFDEDFSGTVKVEDFGKDKCAINAEGVWDESEGDYVGGNVSLLGGTFNLTSYESNGIYASGNVTLSGVAANIIAARDAIEAGGDVSIDLGGKTVQLGKTVQTADLTDENAYEMRFGIEAANVTVTGSGELTIYDERAGINVWDGDIVFDESFTGKCTVYDYGNDPNCCLNALGDVSLLGGTFDLTSQISNGISARGGDITIKNAKVTVDAGADGIAIDHDETITIEDSEIDVKARGDGITVPRGSVNITGSDITIDAGAEDIEYEVSGIYGDAVSIIDSKLDVTAISKTEDGRHAYACGISAMEISISGDESDVTVVAANEEDRLSCAIGDMESVISITGGVVRAKADFAIAAGGENAGALVIGSPAAPMEIKNAEIMTDFDKETFATISEGAGNIAVKADEDEYCGFLKVSDPTACDGYVVIQPKVFSEWSQLGKALSADTPATVDGVFAVSENNGTYTFKLLKNITAEEGDVRFVIPAGKNVILDLNGFTLDRGLKNKDAAVDKGNVFTVNGKLTIQDNSTAQTGTITGGTSAYGAAIISNGETVLESGSITDCKTLSDDYDTTNSQFGRGGAIYVPARGKFTMTGGAIKNCSASVAGGAIFAWSGVVEITGGKISGCSVSGLDDGNEIVKAKGGAVYLLYAQMTMTGGEISGNMLGDVADMRGAGVYVATDAAITLGGTAKITGNTDGKGKASNLFLYDGTTFAISTEQAPANGMNVSVTTKTVPVEGAPVTISGTCSDVATYFKADRSGEKVVFEDAVLKLAVNPNECEYEQKVVSPTSGETYRLKLGGKDMGWFKFEAVDGGWKIIKTSAPGMVGVMQYPYLAMKDGKLIYTDSENATVWTYKNGAFSANKTVTTTKTTTNLLAWIFSFGRKSITTTTTVTVTTTYYLSTVKAGDKLSTKSVCAELYETVTGEHDFGCWIDCKDGEHHKRVCKNCGEVETEAHSYNPDTHKCVCGAYDPAKIGVKIDVDVKEKTTKQYSGFLFWGTWKNVTTYTATIKTEATGVKVTKVQYQLNGSSKWITGSSVCSDKPIETLKVKAWDNKGNVYEYEYPEAPAPTGYTLTISVGYGKVIHDGVEQESYTINNVTTFTIGGDGNRVVTVNGETYYTASVFSGNWYITDVGPAVIGENTLTGDATLHGAPNT